MNKLLLTLIIIVASALGIGMVSRYGLQIINDYAMASYEDKFFPGTYINGKDYSNQTVADVKKDLQEKVLTYEIDVISRGGKTETVTGEMLDLKYADDGEVDAIMNGQDLELWTYYLTNETEYTVESAFSFDEETALEVIRSLECLQTENMVSPTDAYVAESNYDFYIVPETEGDEPDVEKAEQLVLDAIRNEEASVYLDVEGIYVRPSVFSDDEKLNEIVDHANRLLSAYIMYDFTDRVFVVDKTLIRSWLVSDAGGNYSVSESAVAAWVNEMAYETDTFGLPREFKTSYGAVIELAGGGDYGWCIDRDATTATLLNYINQGANVSIDPDYLYTANDRSENDIGGTYVEICITTQTMFCYYNGELIVETPVITGNESTGYATPSGSVWAIDAKWDVVTYGERWKFTLYGDSYADYWMPFNGDVGIHDSDWRSDKEYQTKDYYKTNGSHGCVNTPYDAVKTIYEHVKIGDPVIVYYSVDEVVGPEPTEEAGA